MGMVGKMIKGIKVFTLKGVNKGGIRRDAQTWKLINLNRSMRLITEAMFAPALDRGSKSYGTAKYRNQEARGTTSTKRVP